MSAWGSVHVGSWPISTASTKCPPGRVTRLISATVRSRSSTWSSALMLVDHIELTSENGIASDAAAT